MFRELRRRVSAASQSDHGLSCDSAMWPQPEWRLKLWKHMYGAGWVRNPVGFVLRSTTVGRWALMGMERGQLPLIALMQ